MPHPKRTVILAAGHGGADTGAVSPDGRSLERDQAIIIVDRMAELLREYGYPVVIAPHGQDTHQTIPWVNAGHPAGSGAVAFEVHRDSADSIAGKPDADTRVGIYHSGSRISKAYAEKWAAAARTHGARHNSWCRDHHESRFTGGLGWINQVHTRSFILELAFMQGRNDTDHLHWLAYLAVIAMTDAFRDVPGV